MPFVLSDCLFSIIKLFIKTAAIIITTTMTANNDKKIITYLVCNFFDLGFKYILLLLRVNVNLIQKINILVCYSENSVPV